jgi:hypothetical protein
MLNLKSQLRIEKRSIAFFLWYLILFLLSINLSLVIFKIVVSLSDLRFLEVLRGEDIGASEELFSTNVLLQLLSHIDILRLHVSYLLRDALDLVA